MNATRAWPLEPGEIVLALSGRILGRVGEVDENAFQLVHDDSALWLTDDCIYAVEASGVVLLCEQEGISQYVVPGRSRETKAG